MIPIKKDNFKIRYGPDDGRPVKETNNWIHKTKKSNIDHPLRGRGAADRGVESLRFQVSIVRSKAVSIPTQTGHRFT